MREPSSQRHFGDDHFGLGRAVFNGGHFANKGCRLAVLHPGNRRKAGAVFIPPGIMREQVADSKNARRDKASAPLGPMPRRVVTGRAAKSLGESGIVKGAGGTRTAVRYSIETARAAQCAYEALQGKRNLNHCIVVDSYCPRLRAALPPSNVLCGCGDKRPGRRQNRPRGRVQDSHCLAPYRLFAYRQMVYACTGLPVLCNQ